MRILLIEDERGLSDALGRALKTEGYEIVACYDGDAGLYEAVYGQYDAVILDVMLPGRDGFEVLRRMRKELVRTPVLMLTAKSELESRIKGLDLGADYYLTKPFEMQELFACLRAIVRRPGMRKEEELRFGDLILQKKLCQITCESTGKTVKMGAKEWKLLEILMSNTGMILPKDRLAELVWGVDNKSEYNNIEVYVSFIRKKIAFTGAAVKIKATRGVGYSLEVVK